MKKISLAVGLLALGATFLAAPVGAENITFPMGSGVVNVQDFGAKPNDGGRDTSEILAAMASVANNTDGIIYFPNGTYDLGGTLEWLSPGSSTNPRNRLTFQGQSRDGVILKLRDGTFPSASAPGAVIKTGKNGSEAGNTAFRNSIYNLTVDTGSNNAGAIGIDYLASNKGCIRNVLVRSGDGQGVAGISMTRSWPGPCYLRTVEVQGFNYGVNLSHNTYGVTVEYLTVSGQLVAGVRNDNNMLSIRKLTSTNSVPALLTGGGTGMVCLVDGVLSGGSISRSAIGRSDGNLFVRNVQTSGYAAAIAGVTGADVSTYSSRRSPSPYSSTTTLNLPIQNAPTYWDETLSNWRSVVDDGATPYIGTGTDSTSDDSAAIQRAFDSGKTTVYFPRGNYKVSRTIYIRGQVRHVLGMENIIGFTTASAFDGGKPVFQFDGGTAPVVFERINLTGSFGTGTQAIGIKHASSRTLVLRDAEIKGGTASYTCITGVGDLFIENVVFNKLKFTTSQNIWARQLNVEGSNGPDPYIQNTGGGNKLWILGLKTEGAAPICLTKSGAYTEILGGMTRSATSIPTTTVAFENIGASQSIVYTSYSDARSQDYEIWMRETQGTQTANVTYSQLTPRGAGRFIVLYSGFGTWNTSSTTATTSPSASQF